MKPAPIQEHNPLAQQVIISNTLRTNALTKDTWLVRQIFTLDGQLLAEYDEGQELQEEVTFNGKNSRKK